MVEILAQIDLRVENLRSVRVHKSQSVSEPEFSKPEVLKGFDGCFYTSANAKKNTISVVSRWLHLICMVVTPK